MAGLAESGLESLINVVNRIQRACTLLGDHGGSKDPLPGLWEALPQVVVVGGQSSGKSSVLESIVGRDFLPRGSGIVTRRPLVLQLQRAPGNQEWAEFLHKKGQKFFDFNEVREEIDRETARVLGNNKSVSPVPIHLSIFSPNVVNLTLVDLPGITKVAVEGQPESIVGDIERMVKQFVKKRNSIILAISPANADIATSDSVKLFKEVDPQGERTFGVLTKLDLMDKGTNALPVLENQAVPLKHPWIGVVNRSQADINGRLDLLAAREKEREFFRNSPEYAHLSGRMGTEHLAKVLSQHLHAVIKKEIPKIQAVIADNLLEVEKRLTQLGGPIPFDQGRALQEVLELCRKFDQTFHELLNGGEGGGEKIHRVFSEKLSKAIKALSFETVFNLENVSKVIMEADGYQPHLIAPEQGYRRLIEMSLIRVKDPVQVSVDEVHSILREIVRKAANETKELQRFSLLRQEIQALAIESLETFREEARRMVGTMVEMETSYITADFFRALSHEPLPDNEGPLRRGKGPNGLVSIPTGYLQRIGANVSAYVAMVCDLLRMTIPKAIVHCQVRRAENNMMENFYLTLGKKELKELMKYLREDEGTIKERKACIDRLELLKTARDEISAVL
eukprot:jgi/Mesvir1/2816/Mv13915-RA.2